jgi:Family of unknown function (DUF6011)
MVKKDKINLQKRLNCDMLQWIVTFNLNHLMKFTNPKNGQEIESELTFAQVVETLKEINTEFSLSLAASFCNPQRLTQGQEFWGHKLAKEKRNPAPASEGQVFTAFTPILEMFQKAKSSGLKTPKIKILVGNEKGQLSLAPDTGKNPGCIYLKVSDEYAGKITPDGKFHKTNGCSVQVENHLIEMGKNPAGIASLYGHTTGNCCFCNRELTDERSLTVGYGPKCASVFSLPWGDEVKKISEMRKEEKKEVDEFAEFD